MTLLNNAWLKAFWRVKVTPRNIPSYIVWGTIVASWSSHFFHPSETQEVMLGSILIGGMIIFAIFAFFEARRQRREWFWMKLDLWVANKWIEMEAIKTGDKDIAESMRNLRKELERL